MLLFQLLLVLLLPLINKTLFNTLLGWFHEIDEIPRILARALPGYATFFMTYICNAYAGPPIECCAWLLRCSNGVPRSMLHGAGCSSSASLMCSSLSHSSIIWCGERGAHSTWHAAAAPASTTDLSRQQPRRRGCPAGRVHPPRQQLTRMRRRPAALVRCPSAMAVGRSAVRRVMVRALMAWAPSARTSTTRNTCCPCTRAWSSSPRSTMSLWWLLRSP